MHFDITTQKYQNKYEHLKKNYGYKREIVFGNGIELSYLILTSQLWDLPGGVMISVVGRMWSRGSIHGRLNHALLYGFAASSLRMRINEESRYRLVNSDSR